MVEQIAVLLGLLEDGPKSSIALRDAMGVTAREIGRLCTRLAALQQIHYVGKQAGGIGRPPAIWKLGSKGSRSDVARHTVSGFSVLEQIKKIGEPVHVRQLSETLRATPRAINQSLYRLEKKGLIRVYDRIPHPDVYQAKSLARWVAAESHGEGGPTAKKQSGNNQVFAKIQEIGDPVTTLELVDSLGVTRCAVQASLTRLHSKGLIEMRQWVPHPKVRGQRIAQWQVRNPDAPPVPVPVPEPRGVSRIYITPEDVQWMAYWQNYKAKRMAMLTQR